MDCIDGMKLLDDECIDLLVTSPPYDNLRRYKGFSFDFDKVAYELFRVVKQGGVVVWIVNDGEYIIGEGESAAYVVSNYDGETVYSNDDFESCLCWIFNSI